MNQWRNLKIQKEKAQDQITSPRSPNPRQENPTLTEIKDESGSTSSTSARIEIPHLLRGEGIGSCTVGVPVRTRGRRVGEDYDASANGPSRLNGGRLGPRRPN
ncbi:hypothetical protein BHM03_00061978 [Ensete ventricosum]|nr:hypothetical protein BHM03_00061978 [Ensete ventricosum]